MKRVHGLMWQIETETESLQEGVEKAVEGARKKFSREPEVVQVHDSLLDKVSLDDITIIGGASNGLPGICVVGWLVEEGGEKVEEYVTEQSFTAGSQERITLCDEG